jgi:hypothetical protein
MISVVAVLMVLLFALIRMAASHTRDSRMAFLNAMLGERRVRQKEKHERHLASGTHHRHRFGF